jgi:hypothetical protein
MFMFHAAWPASHQPAFRPTRGSGDGTVAETIGVTGLGIVFGGVGGGGGGLPRPPRPAAAGWVAAPASAACGRSGAAAAGCVGCAAAPAAGCAAGCAAAAGGVFGAVDAGLVVALPHAAITIASAPALSVPVIRDISCPLYLSNMFCMTPISTD